MTTTGNSSGHFSWTRCTASTVTIRAPGMRGIVEPRALERSVGRIGRVVDLRSR
ncbi:hypothetical protein ACW4TU_42515 [Streptomyces sp. QTS52]